MVVKPRPGGSRREVVKGLLPLCGTSVRDVRSHFALFNHCFPTLLFRGCFPLFDDELLGALLCFCKEEEGIVLSC